MEDLIYLKNINPELADKLIKVGIDTAEKLREKGSRHVFIKIKTIDSGACHKMLLHLEGAIQDVFAENLSNENKEELMAFMEIFNR